ncbi:DUF2059 domain-containing protein [Deltaproteobacteria bacterium TL4]
MKNYWLLITFVIYLYVTPLASAQLSSKMPPSKQADIELLMKITGATRLGNQVVDQVLSQLEEMLPKVPKTFWKEARLEAAPEKLISLIVPVYDKHLTHEEIKGLIQFYTSPLGQKFVSVVPKISDESIAMSQEWGGKLTLELAKKLEQAGYHP